MGDLRDQISQVVMMGIADLSPTPEEKELIAQGVGCVILFERNCPSPAHVADLIEELQEIALKKGPAIPLIIAIDQEHGPVARIKQGITPFPSAWDIGQLGDPALARQAAGICGKELALLGITMNLAPVADLFLDPANRVIGKRSFGKDPHRVAAMVAAVVHGLQGEGVAACAKHFPGHGATAIDSHQKLPIIERSRIELEQAELIPFQQTIEAGVAAIMPGHLLCPALDTEQPATFSPYIIQGLLRQQLGFDGVVISDDLCMGALAQWGGIAERGIAGLKAGVDILLSGREKVDVDGLLTALDKGLKSGDIPEQRVKEAVARVLKLKAQYPYQGRGDAAALRQEEDLTFAEELAQRVNNAAGDPGDRAA
jgi:beta-N-acetylhexosaminidase